MNRSKLNLKMPKQTMHRKLFFYTFVMAILLLALLATMLILLGRCPYCKLGIPAFSQYCPYCGEKLEK